MKKHKTYKKFKESLLGFNLPDLSLDINGLKRTSVPTSDKISGACIKKTTIKVKLPEGKTISQAYNKGGYQVVDKSDFKSMGKKI